MYNNKTFRRIILASTFFVFVIAVIFLALVIVYNGKSSDRETRKEELCMVTEEPKYVYQYQFRGMYYYAVYIKVDVLNKNLTDRKAIYTIKPRVRLSEAEEQLKEIDGVENSDNGITCWVPNKTEEYNEDRIEDTTKLIVIDYSENDAIEYRDIYVASAVLCTFGFVIGTVLGIYALILYGNITKK